MKKIVIILGIIFFCMIVVLAVFLTQNKENLASIYKENAIYEQYKDKQIFGTEVASIMNKAIDQNLKNGIEQDEKGFFIENENNSIKIEVKLQDEENLKTYQMETIQKVGNEKFVQNFNLILFQCTNIEYHEKTKKIAKLVFEQKEE